MAFGLLLLMKETAGTSRVQGTPAEGRLYVFGKTPITELS